MVSTNYCRDAVMVSRNYCIEMPCLPRFWFYLFLSVLQEEIIRLIHGQGQAIAKGLSSQSRGQGGISLSSWQTRAVSGHINGCQQIVHFSMFNAF